MIPGSLGEVGDYFITSLEKKLYTGRKSEKWIRKARMLLTSEFESRLNKSSETHTLT